MWLAFVLSLRWPPYAKWRGTLFQSLAIAADLEQPLTAAATAPRWTDREPGLAGACEILLDAQRERGFPTPAPAVTPFWDRPYRSVDQAVPEALLASITDPDVIGLPSSVGSVEQWASSAGILTSPDRRKALQAAYRAWAGQS
jgi:hypothetical protein